MQATAIRTAKASTGGTIQGLEPTGIETDYPVRGRKLGVNPVFVVRNLFKIETDYPVRGRKLN